MKKTFITFLIGTMFLVSCGSGSNNKTTTETSEPKKEQIAKPTPPKAEGPIRVLFVGNSHTEYYVSFPEALTALAKENNKEIEVSTLLKMGVSIDKILSGNKLKANKLFAEVDSDGNYFDYVILQESTPVAIQKEKQFASDCKMMHDAIIKNSPEVATYIYELMAPFDASGSDYKDYQKILDDNVETVAKSLPNTGILQFATALQLAYSGQEDYTAIKDGKDLLRHTDSSCHMLNDALFLNSIVLYRTLFGETPKIPQQLPLTTGTGDNDDIKMMDVNVGVSNPAALEKIAASI